MRLIHLAMFMILVGLAWGASDDTKIDYNDLTLYIGDSISIGDYHIEFVDVQSIKDGLVVVQVTKFSSNFDEQRVLMEGNANNFDGGSENGGITLRLVEIFDEQSAKIRIEYPQDMGSPRKQLADKAQTVKNAPDLVITESFDKDDLRVGDNLESTITVTNVGRDPAYDIELKERPPLSQFSYVAGYPPKIKGELGPGESDTAVYTMSAVKEGTVKLPPLVVKYADSKKNAKTNSSESVRLIVRNARKPDLKLTIQSPGTLSYGESGIINISIKNMGEASAYKVEIISLISPSGLEVGSLDNSFFEIKPGESEQYSANVRGSKSGNYTITLKTSFQNGDESKTLKDSKAEVVVLEQEYKYLYFLLIIPLVIIGVWIYKRHKEYKY
jgi:hypothetical protein